MVLTLTVVYQNTTALSFCAIT